MKFKKNLISIYKKLDVISNLISKKINKKKVIQSKSDERKRLKLKKCLECGIEFKGHIISKYCDKHRKEINRIKIVKKILKKEDTNIVIKHEKHEITKMVLNCALCHNEYEIELIPQQYIYPKFCNEHRNEYKRKIFIKNNKK